MLRYKNNHITLLSTTILILKEDCKVIVDSHAHFQGRTITLPKGTECVFDRTNDWDATFFKTNDDGINFKLEFHPTYIKDYFDIV